MHPILSKVYKLPLFSLSEKHYQKLLIDTLNVHCFNTALEDADYNQALLKSDILIPDGAGIVFALNYLYGVKLKKIAGYDLFTFEMKYLNLKHGKCFFLGSSDNVLRLISQRIKEIYPSIRANFFSPPFKSNFSDEDNKLMIDQINLFAPDVLFIGMTAPKQEKWAAAHFEELNVKHICCIGAVFDFFAGTVKRSPQWMIKNSLEWFYRLIKEPRRLWRRYIVGNYRYAKWVMKEKLNKRSILFPEDQ